MSNKIPTGKDNIKEEDLNIEPRIPVKDEAFYTASQWQLIWWKFRKHKLAMIAMPILIIIYIGAIFCEIFGTVIPTTRFPEYKSAPPQMIKIYEKGEGFTAPFVYEIKQVTDPKTFRRTFEVDTTQKYPVKFFQSGEPYKLWGIFRMDLHVLSSEGPLFLFGTDELGRDLWTRIVYASRISLSVGMVGVLLTFVLGLLLGGLSGFFGGFTDTIVQRSIDLVICIPTIPLWMALAAALPPNWSTIKTYFAIIIIMSLINWTTLARVVRGKLLSLREEDFVIAAKISGAKSGRIIVKHMLPSFLSYIIVAMTLSIPYTILGETALSFLGLGLRPPVVSWGVLLQQAQNFVTIAHFPWLLWPIAWIVVTVLMFNFLGDGLRDAADPYK